MKMGRRGICFILLIAAFCQASCVSEHSSSYISYSVLDNSQNPSSNTKNTTLVVYEGESDDESVIIDADSETKLLLSNLYVTTVINGAEIFKGYLNGSIAESAKIEDDDESNGADDGSVKFSDSSITMEGASDNEEDEEEYVGMPFTVGIRDYHAPTSSKKGSASISVTYNYNTPKISHSETVTIASDGKISIGV